MKSFWPHITSVLPHCAMGTCSGMWTSRGSAQAGPEAGVKILQPVFSGSHLTPTRHLLAEEIKHSMIMSTPATMEDPMKLKQSVTNVKV